MTIPFERQNGNDEHTISLKLTGAPWKLNKNCPFVGKTFKINQDLKKSRGNTHTDYEYGDKL